MRKFFFGLALGGAVLYFLDPERGAGRRARARGLVQREKQGSTVIEESRAAAEPMTEVNRVVGEDIARVEARPVKANGTLTAEPITG